MEPLDLVATELGSHRIDVRVDHLVHPLDQGADLDVLAHVHVEDFGGVAQPHHLLRALA